MNNGWFFLGALLLFWAAVPGCDDDNELSEENDAATGDADADTDTDTDADTDADSDTATDSDIDTETQTNEDTDTASLLDEINQLFPYSADQDPLKVFFTCVRRGSALAYDFDFLGDGTFQVHLVTDLSEPVTLAGTYQYEGGTISIDPIDTLTFYPEKSKNIQIFMGMIIYFESVVDDPAADPDQTEMSCVSLGHHYNDAELEEYRFYNSCDVHLFNTLRYDNAFEFTAHSSVHTDLPVPGALFRQRDWIAGDAILRGYGIYRRVGDTYYAYFGEQFDDVNLFKGQFLNNDQQITVPQIGIGCRF